MTSRSFPGPKEFLIRLAENELTNAKDHLNRAEQHPNLYGPEDIAGYRAWVQAASEALDYASRSNAA